MDLLADLRDRASSARSRAACVLYRHIAAASPHAPAQARDYSPQLIASRKASYRPVRKLRETANAVLPDCSVQSATTGPPKSTASLTATGSRSGNGYARTVSGRLPSELLVASSCQPVPQLLLTLATSLPQPVVGTARSRMPSTVCICPSLAANTHRAYLSRAMGAAE